MAKKLKELMFSTHMMDSNEISNYIKDNCVLSKGDSMVVGLSNDISGKYYNIIGNNNSLLSTSSQYLHSTVIGDSNFISGGDYHTVIGYQISANENSHKSMLLGSNIDANYDSKVMNTFVWNGDRETYTLHEIEGKTEGEDFIVAKEGRIYLNPRINNIIKYDGDGIFIGYKPASEIIKQLATVSFNAGFDKACELYGIPTRFDDGLVIDVEIVRESITAHETHVVIKNITKTNDYDTVYVNWGDGSGIEKCVMNGSKTKQISHEYLKDGKYQIVFSHNVKSIQFATTKDDQTKVNKRTIVSINRPGLGMNSVGSYAFYQLLALSSANIATVSSIGGHAFQSCSVLKEVEFGDQLTSIAGYAFEGCQKLQSISIPQSVKTIGEKAFFDCKGLLSVTFNSLSSDLTFDHGYNDKNPVFSNMNKVQHFEFHDNLKCLSGLFTGNEYLTEVVFGDTYKGTSIGKQTFKDCKALSSITIPQSIKIIDQYAFDGCGQLTAFEGIKDSQLTVIGQNGASNCSSIINIKFPTTMYRLGNNALENDVSLSGLGLNSGFGKLGDYSLYNCKALTSLSIPTSLTDIGNNTFSGCSNILSISFGTNSKLSSIGQEAFNGCVNLETIDFSKGSTKVPSVQLNSFDGIGHTVSCLMKDASMYVLWSQNEIWKQLEQSQKVKLVYQLSENDSYIMKADGSLVLLNGTTTAIESNDKTSIIFS